jgi:hypothetical protein
MVDARLIRFLQQEFLATQGATVNGVVVDAFVSMRKLCEEIARLGLELPQTIAELERSGYIFGDGNSRCISQRILDAKPTQAITKERSTPPLAELLSIRAKPCELVSSVLYEAACDRNGEMDYKQAWLWLREGERWRELLPRCTEQLRLLLGDYDPARFRFPQSASVFEQYASRGLSARGRRRNAPRYGRASRSVVHQRDL